MTLSNQLYGVEEDITSTKMQSGFKSKESAKVQTSARRRRTLKNLNKSKIKLSMLTTIVINYAWRKIFCLLFLRLEILKED